MSVDGRGDWRGVIVFGLEIVAAFGRAFVVAWVLSGDDRRGWTLALGGGLLAFAMIGAFCVWVLHPWLIARLPAATRPGTAGLFIRYAYYGANEGRWNEVTDVVRSYVADNSLYMGVGNSIFGGDPAGGFEKDLRVMYELDGVAAEATFHEGADAVLPPPDTVDD